MLSEVHLECRRQPGGCPALGSPESPPTAGSGAAPSSGVAPTATTTILVSSFHTAAGGEVVCIQHALATPLRRVGLQVWRGALLLADYLLQQAQQGAKQQGGQQQGGQQQGQQQGPASSWLHGCTALELGAGSGLAGLVLSAVARRVFLTGGQGRYCCAGLW